MIKQYRYSILIFVSLATIMLGYFASVYLKPYVGHSVVLEMESQADHIEALLTQHDINGPAVIYVRDNTCLCNVIVDNHYKTLAQRYSSITFYQTHDKTVADEGAVRILSNDSFGPSALKLPATPAALIIDSTGQLVYAGPHSLSAFCTDDSSIIKSVIDSLKPSNNAVQLNSLAEGCLCQS